MSSSDEEVTFDSSNAGNNEDQEGSSGDEESETEELSGWADSMSKILKSTKPKNKKSLILSRAKKDYEVNKEAKPKKGNDIEIAKDEKLTSTKGDNEEHTAEEAEGNDALSAKQRRKLELRQRKLERAWENLNRITTENPDREMEVNLLKIATKGVVQLFNAVAQQQKSLKSKLRDSSKSEFKKDKVLSQSKDLFDKAMSKNRIQDVEDDGSDADDPVEIKQESSSDEGGGSSIKDKRKRKQTSVKTELSSKKPMWQALQDDFMLDAKLKDWDKESDSD